MTWLLVVVTSAFGFSTEFTDKSSCEAAKAAIKENAYLVRVAECYEQNWNSH